LKKFKAMNGNIKIKKVLLPKVQRFYLEVMISKSMQNQMKKYIGFLRNLRTSGDQIWTMLEFNLESKKQTI